MKTAQVKIKISCKKFGSFLFSGSITKIKGGDFRLKVDWNPHAITFPTQAEVKKIEITY